MSTPVFLLAFLDLKAVSLHVTLLKRRWAGTRGDSAVLFTSCYNPHTALESKRSTFVFVSSTPEETSS